MYVEKLTKEMIKELSFRILVERVHRFPNNNLELKDVKNIIKGHNSISFDLEYADLKTNKTKTIKITANSHELFVNNNFSKAYTKVFNNYLREIFKINQSDCCLK